MSSMVNTPVIKTLHKHHFTVCFSLTKGRRNPITSSGFHEHLYTHGIHSHRKTEIDQWMDRHTEAHTKNKNLFSKAK